MDLIQGKFVAIGDTHFFDKNFNLEYFENQMKFYERQLIPYMVENNIKHIIQTGDLFDNRTTINIHLFNLFNERFCKLLKKHDLHMISFLGNHDIVFKNTLVFNMTKYLQELYPETFTIIQEQTIIDINSQKVGIVPWLVPDATIDPIMLETADYIFGHFELNGYNHTKYVIDDKSELTASVFKNQKKVFSGHYHLNHAKGKVHYIGTPYQSNFGEFGNNVGFYVFNEDFTYEFHKNQESDIHVKFTYDERADFPLKMYYDDEVFVCVTLDALKDIKNINAKFIMDYSENAKYEEYLLVLKENSVKYTFTNNQEIDALVNPDRVSLDKDKLKSTENFILDYISQYNPELLEVTTKILKEVSEEQDG